MTQGKIRRFRRVMIETSWKTILLSGITSALAVGCVRLRTWDFQRVSARSRQCEGILPKVFETQLDEISLLEQKANT